MSYLFYCIFTLCFLFCIFICICICFLLFYFNLFWSMFCPRPRLISARLQAFFCCPKAHLQGPKAWPIITAYQASLSSRPADNTTLQCLPVVISPPHVLICSSHGFLLHSIHMQRQLFCLQHVWRPHQQLFLLTNSPVTPTCFCQFGSNANPYCFHTLCSTLLLFYMKKSLTIGQMGGCRKKQKEKVEILGLKGRRTKWIRGFFLAWV